VRRLLTRLPAFFRGTLGHGHGLWMRSFQRLSVTGETDLLFHVDGEPGETGGPIAVDVVSRALVVVTA
jgi:diacylglycerol kinase family enzyme